MERRVILCRLQHDERNVAPWHPGVTVRPGLGRVGVPALRLAAGAALAIALGATERQCVLAVDHRVERVPVLDPLEGVGSHTRCGAAPAPLVEEARHLPLKAQHLGGLATAPGGASLEPMRPLALPLLDGLVEDGFELGVAAGGDGVHTDVVCARLDADQPTVVQLRPLLAAASQREVGC